MWAIASRVPVGRGPEGGAGRRGELLLVSKPAVQRVSMEELGRVLPWSGSGRQLAKEVGNLEACTARVALSLVACSLVYNTSIEVASVAALYWAWAPILGTAFPNMLLRLRYRYAGVWSARVIHAQVVSPQKLMRSEGEGLAARVFNMSPQIPTTLRLQIGDGSAATFQMQVPLKEDVPEVQAGERVDVLVMSDMPSLSRFKAVHDVYFPDRRLWLSETPYIETELFEGLRQSLNGTETSVSRPPREQYIQKRTDGRRANLLLEENTLSRDSIDLEKAVRIGPGLSRSKEFNYVQGVEKGKKDRRRVKELDETDLY